jgi:hypothetical protein
MAPPGYGKMVEGAVNGSATAGMRGWWTINRMLRMPHLVQQVRPVNTGKRSGRRQYDDYNYIIGCWSCHE